MEGPLQDHHRKASSLFGYLFGGIDAIPPVSPANDEDASGKKSWPTSSTLQSITSVLKRSDSAPTSPRRSPSRPFPRRLNISLGTGNEAVTAWKRLPPLPSVQGVLATNPSQSHRAADVEDLPKSPFHHKEEPKSPGFRTSHDTLPASPSTVASSESSLVYAPPSPTEIPPINGLTIPHTSYPPLPTSVPSISGSFSYPPTPRCADNFMDTRAIHAVGQIAHPVTNNSPLPYGPDRDGVGRSIRLGSMVSAFSQHSTAQELVLPPLALLDSPPSPSRSMSPKGPRPRPAPGQLSRSAAHSQEGFTDQ